MNKWAQLAMVHFSQAIVDPTPKTPEYPLLGVLGVPTPCVSENAAFSNDALIASAMRACDFYKDSELAREDMRLEVLSTPTELQADLLAHFQRTYGGRYV